MYLWSVSRGLASPPRPQDPGFLSCFTVPHRCPGSSSPLLEEEGIPDAGLISLGFCCLLSPSCNPSLFCELVDAFKNTWFLRSIFSGFSCCRGKSSGFAITREQRGLQRTAVTHLSTSLRPGPAPASPGPWPCSLGHPGVFPAAPSRAVRPVFLFHLLSPSSHITMQEGISHVQSSPSFLVRF